MTDQGSRHSTKIEEMSLTSPLFLDTWGTRFFLTIRGTICRNHRPREIPFTELFGFHLIAIRANRYRCTANES